MAIFQDISLSWNGAEFVIPANRVLSAIAVVEETITFSELIACMQRGKPPLAAISGAFAGLLRFAGAKVPAEEVYAGMFTGQVAEKVIEAVNILLMMMMPPASIAGLKVGSDQAKRGNRGAASKPSKRSTRRRSAAAR